MILIEELKFKNIKVRKKMKKISSLNSFKAIT